MSIKPNQDLILAFLNAVATWKAYVKANKLANKRNLNAYKSALTKAVFFWRFKAESLKKELDSLLLNR